MRHKPCLTSEDVEMIVAAAKKYAAQFPSVKLFTLSSVAGDWSKAQKTHFADGGLFDQIYQTK